MNGAEILTKFTADTTQVDKATEKVSNNFDTLAEAGVNMFKALTFTADSFAVSILATGVSYNAEMETYMTRLETLTGSMEEANKVLDQIKKDALATPFDVSSLTQAESLLLATGISAEDARKDILALGDAIAASGGGNAELQRMAVNLQQIKNVGKASALDIKQFAYAGIDIYGLLADSMGITREEASKLDVSYDMLSKALQKASGEGGKYYKAMEKQSKTMNGATSNLKESYKQLTGELSQGVFEIIKDLIPKLTELFNWLTQNKDIVLAVASALLVMFNSLTAILIITNVTGLITAFSAVVGVSTGVIGLWIIALGLVVAAFVLLWNKCEWFRDGVKAVWAVITDVFSAAYEFIYNFVIEPMIAKIIGLVDKVIWLKDQVIDIWGKIKDKLAPIGDFFKGIFDGITGAFKECINWIIDKFNWFIDQVNKIKFPNWDWLGDLAGKGFNFEHLNRLATGTNYVPQDMLAVIHEGEAVVPKKFNPYANGINATTISGMGTLSPTINITINNDMEMDTLGQLVNKVKTYSGGAKNDFNYGMGR